MNRLTTISYPDTTSASYGYDVLSRLSTAANPTGTVTIAYDSRSRASSVTDVFGQVVSYAYDANGNRTQLSLNGGTSATYQYDLLNRLTQLTDSASLNTSFGYDATNKLTSRTLPNGVVTTSQYDGLNRLTRLTHAKGVNTLADFQYQFNAVSNITQMIDGAGSHNYTYDARDRLTAATHPNQTNENYTLDDVGNRTASHQGSSYTYQAFNRLTAANSNSYAYDANGNLNSKTDASGTWTYTWDYENRLRQASLSGGVTVNNSYDGLGRRIQRTSSTGGTTKFVYDGADVLRDLDGSGSTIADYLNAPGIDNKLRQTTSGAVSYFASDHLATTRALTDATGSPSSTLNYDSFGNVISGSASTRYTYTGRESDSDTGLMFYRARWYDPAQGRFVSEDPIGLSGGLNVFAYVKNQPIQFRDPEGLRLLISADDFSDPYRGEHSRFDPTYKSPVDRFTDRYVDPYFQIIFGGGGLFRRDVFVEFISANERSRQPCKKFGERFVESFTETNAAVPGLVAPTGAGLIPSRKAAEIVGEPTLFYWADNWFAPPNGISNGPFLKGAIVRSGLVSLAVSGAWEAGVGVGSFIDAAGCPCGY